PGHDQRQRRGDRRDARGEPRQPWRGRAHHQHRLAGRHLRRARRGRVRGLQARGDGLFQQHHGRPAARRDHRHRHLLHLPRRHLDADAVRQAGGPAGRAVLLGCPSPAVGRGARGRQGPRQAQAGHRDPGLAGSDLAPRCGLPAAGRGRDAPDGEAGPPRAEEATALQRPDPAMTTRTAGAVTTHRSPSRESTLLYWAARATLRHVYRAWPLTEAGIRGLAAVERGFTRLPLPRGVRVESRALGGVPVETTTPDAVAGDAAGDVAVLYLPGGAFVFCGPGTHRRVCGRLAQNLGAPVHSVAYRKLPEVDLGTVVRDAYAAYRALSDELPAGHRIVVAGDSAGGFLAAKL